MVEISDCKKMFPNLDIMEVSALESTNIEDVFLKLLSSFFFKKYIFYYGCDAEFS